MPTKVHDDIDSFYLFNLNIIIFIINILILLSDFADIASTYLRSYILLQDEYLF